MRISDWSSDVCSSDLNRLEAAPASRSPTTTKQKRGTRERVRRVTCRPPSIPNLQHLLLRDTTSKPPGPHLQHTLGVERYHQAQQTITQLARPRHRFGLGMRPAKIGRAPV